MEYKLIAIDMDGTLLNGNNQISKVTMEAIKKAEEAGVYIVLATGRILKSAAYYASTLGLNKPIISCNGALAIDENKDVLFHYPMDGETIKEIVKAAEKEDIYFHFYDDEKFYSRHLVDEIMDFYSEATSEFKIDFIECDDFNKLVASEGFKAYKFLFIDNDQNKLERFREILERKSNITVSSSWENNIEATSKNVSKGHALIELGKILNIDPSEMIAIGDGENDSTMIEIAGLGVAMGNGSDSLKEKADFITLSNKEDGVAHVINKFILKQEMK